MLPADHHPPCLQSIQEVQCTNIPELTCLQPSSGEKFLTGFRVVQQLTGKNDDDAMKAWSDFMVSNVRVQPSKHITQADSSADWAFKFGDAVPGLKCFSFAELVKDRDAIVRVTDDGLLYVVDLVVVVTGKDIDHASQSLRGISKELFDPEKYQERQLRYVLLCPMHR
jgi:hypothetical protein